MLNDDTVLVGQSLNSDLAALRLSHPHIIDTSVIYHHSRGPPYKAGLKWLSQRFLKREIQTSVNAGHSPIEDARACLDLLKLKLDKGETFGTSDDNRESIFKRLARPPHGPKKTAVVDYGEPAKWYGAYATHTIACSTDEGISKGMGKCAAGDDTDAIPPMDFVWGRLRGLETAREFCTKDSQQIDIDGPLPELQRDPPRELLAEKVKETVERIREVYEALPKCTAFMVYSGTGDPRQWRRMLDLQKRFKEEFKVRKWDEVSVKWTDAEEQELKNALKIAKRGVGFMVVK
jgi:RNA exonuclease 1